MVLIGQLYLYVCCVSIPIDSLCSMLLHPFIFVYCVSVSSYSLRCVLMFVFVENSGFCGLLSFVTGLVFPSVS
jgi:hypothetical protein